MSTTRKAEPLPHQLVWQARQIAEKHGLRVVGPVTDVKVMQGERTLVESWVVYRGNERLYKCGKAKRLLAKVRVTAGVAEQ